MVRKSVEGRDVIIGIEIVNIERKEAEEKEQQQPSSKIMFEKRKNRNNHRNRNNKIGSACDRKECFWKGQTHKKKRITQQEG